MDGEEDDDDDDDDEEEFVLLNKLLFILTFDCVFENSDLLPDVVEACDCFIINCFCASNFCVNSAFF